MTSICFVEVENIYELARLACAFEHISMPIFALRLDKPILAISGETIKDTLIFYYTFEDSIGEFLAYKYTLKEDIKFTDTAIDPTYMYAPIISIKSIPYEWSSSELIERCEIVILKDLNSLAKLAAYKAMIDEIPTALFYTQHLLGTFVSFNNIDTYFYCIEMNEYPTYDFIKYSISTQASFTNRIEEHGYIYSKIIRLKNKHSLIMA